MIRSISHEGLSALTLLRYNTSSTSVLKDVFFDHYFKKLAELFCHQENFCNFALGKLGIMYCNLND